MARCKKDNSLSLFLGILYVFYAHLIIGHLIGARLPDVAEETEATSKPRLSLQTKTLGKKSAASTNVKDSLASIFTIIRDKIHFNLHVVDVVIDILDIYATKRKNNVMFVL